MADDNRSAGSIPTRLAGVDWRQAAVGALAYAAIWWVLVGGEPDSWLVGVPVVLLASVSSVLFTRGPASRWSLVGTLRFVPYFLWESLCGGWNAAVLVFTRPRGLRPAVIDYRMTLPAGVPRALMVGIAGLLPGTLAVEFEDNRLQVHVLDAAIPARDELSRLERHIAAMSVQRSNA